MERLKQTVVGGVLVGLVLGLLQLALPAKTTAYGEQSGAWSETEKREILSLLRDIERNTRRN